MKLQGKVFKKNAVQSFDSGFQKQEIYLETQEQYQQYINIEFLKDKIDLLNSVNEGDMVEVSININGRLYNDKCYNQITAWRVEKLNDGKAEITTAEKPIEVSTLLDEDDNLPF